jgi:O-antigen ligase
MPKFIEIFKRFTFAVLTLYIVTVPVSSSAAAIGEDPIFQKGINILTVLTTLLVLICVFLQWQSDRKSIKTEPYLVLTALIYLIICFASAVFAESNIEHCLSRVFTLFCFLNNAFWPHILFPSYKHLKFLNGAIIFASLVFSGLFSAMAVLNNFSFNRYDYTNVGQIFGLEPEVGLSFDPNIMLFGFMYGLITIFSLYSSEKLPAFIPAKMGIVGLGVLMVALLGLMFSRTTAIALSITLTIYLIRRYFRDYRFWVIIGVIIFLVIVSIPEISEFVGKSEIYTNATEGREISNDDRFKRLDGAIVTWLSDLKNIVIGRGYGIEIILDVDPHNIYLTHLHSIGLTGFLAFAAFIFAMKFYAKNLDGREQGVLDLSYIYIAIGAATYWHNKSMWVIFLLCLMRTKVYRTQQHIPATVYDFEEHPLTKLGSQMTTFLTGLFSPNKNRQRRAKIKMAKKSKQPIRKNSDLQTLAKIASQPVTKTQPPQPNPELDFEEELPTKLRTGWSKLFTDLGERRTNTSKKMKQMSRKDRNNQ